MLKKINISCSFFLLLIRYRFAGYVPGIQATMMSLPSRTSSMTQL
jgi:hypothetical protein